MDSNTVWKHELGHMLEVIEKQSTASLGKINQQFKALDLLFDEKFCQEVLKMAVLRLKSSFMQIDVENRAQSSHGHGQNAAHSNASQSANHLMGISSLSEKKVLIEIDDSGDELEMNVVKTEQQENPLQNDIDVNNLLTSATSTNSSDCGIKIVSINGGPNVLAKIQAANAHTISFDRHQVANGNSTANDGSMATLSLNSMEAGQYTYTRETPLKNVQKKVGQFKCKHCKYGSDLKGNLKTHAKIHVRENSMGLARDPRDGLLHCSHCSATFHQLRAVIAHMQKFHSKNW